MLRALLPWQLLSVRVIEVSPFWIDFFASSNIIVMTPVLLIVLLCLLRSELPLLSLPFMMRNVRPIINPLHRIVLLVFL